jgi:hypothetical protein
MPVENKAVLLNLLNVSDKLLFGAVKRHVRASGAEKRFSTAFGKNEGTGRLCRGK